MRKITEMTILLREQVELPDGFELATDAFHEGWNLARSVDAQRLEEKIHSQGWHSIRIAEGLLRNGVGKTSQQATECALMLALRHVGTLFNVAEVEHIELSEYPWFFLARVQIYPFRIQQSAILPLPDHYEPVPIKPRQRRLPLHATALYPHFGSDVPLLKHMLVSSRASLARPV
jgi:hypothetical protein